MLKKLIDNKQLVINPPVFITSILLIIALIAVCVLFPTKVGSWFAIAQNSVTTNFGWFFVLTVNVILIFAIYLAFSKFGKIRLGGEDAEPEFSKGSWFAMLFSTGMGIGIMFFSIAEPVSHFGTPPRPVDNEIQGAIQAMEFTSLHWGLHAWAIYAMVGLALAFFGFNRKLPMTFRSLFYPFWGEKIHGWWGHVIDILSTLATVFGLSTSLGLGVTQITAGLNYLYGWEISPLMQAGIILVVISIATVSVFSGLDKGVKILSTANMYIASVFMLMIFFLGPTLFILKGYVQNTGSYLANFIDISTWNETYLGNGWQNVWTIFYWAWWIAWSPFVGSFIARISKGRTVKEFILGVLIVPGLITLLWMNVFGGSALEMILSGDLSMVTAVKEDISTALFVFLEHFPLAKFLSIIAIILIFSFFITSSDSGSLVVDNITSGSFGESPVWQRVFWSFTQGFIAIVLLWGGGLDALQTAVIITGLPFAVILLVMCYSLQKGLQEELNKQHKKQKSKQEKSYKDIISELIDEQQK
ncbi:BCCT family transporter [Myroides phaeus]|uniref:Choline/glycine/proline betaine transport protein n=1 Tax=Myroides phaeus TaxID=702745 RepID=A0A1G8C6J5_9FLAO|nr:BCCT family transporter [Myroides phaeus]MEC4115454.1 BCCT family transporter [Myroides phaeus]SDH41004.1 choline/glycine/proline betaine transport protein [Myroides phaeus]